MKTDNEKPAGQIPEPEIKKMHYENGQFDLQLEHPMTGMLIDGLVMTFRAAGASNYLSMTATHKESGDEYVVTIQRKDGMTPAEKAAKLEREIESLKGTIAGLHAHIDELGAVK